MHGLSEIRVWADNTFAPKRDSALVKKAFWFHDAVYSHDDDALYSSEEASAQLWLASGLDAGDNLDVAQLIRATDHFQGPGISHALKDAMLSADLAILGQDEEVYQAYTQAIGREYAHVDPVRFNQQRGLALQHLSAKAQAGQLFGDAYFADQYNERAIDNMRKEIAALAGN